MVPYYRALDKPRYSSKQLSLTNNTEIKQKATQPEFQSQCLLADLERSVACHPKKTPYFQERIDSWRLLVEDLVETPEQIRDVFLDKSAHAFEDCWA